MPVYNKCRFKSIRLKLWDVTKAILLSFGFARVCEYFLKLSRDIEGVVSHRKAGS